GHEKKDDRALGFAAFLDAKVDERRLRLAKAARGYRKAARHFETAKQLSWQAGCVNDVGSVLQEQGEQEEALKHYRLALKMWQGPFPKEKYRHGHPHLAGSLNNMGGVLQEQGEYEAALKHYRLALQMRQGLYPKEKFPLGHPYVAQSLNNVG